MHDSRGLALGAREYNIDEVLALGHGAHLLEIVDHLQSNKHPSSRVLRNGAKTLTISFVGRWRVSHEVTYKKTTQDRRSGALSLWIATRRWPEGWEGWTSTQMYNHSNHMRQDT